MWLWIAIEPIEPIHSLVLRVYLSRHRNMLVAESFFPKSIIKSYGWHIVVYTQMKEGIWYPETCSLSFGLKDRLHSSSEKNIIKRSIHYFKDRMTNVLMVLLSL